MAKKDKKIDSIRFQCTVKWKSRLTKICENVGLSLSAFIIIAINEKIKRDDLEDRK